MSVHEGRQELVKRTLILFLVVDVSGSMKGQKIGIVNQAIREFIAEIQNQDDSDVDLQIVCLEFSDGCKEMYPNPIEASKFNWQDLEAEGQTDLGAAAIKLSAKLDEVYKSQKAAYVPTIFLLSDGEPTDDYEPKFETMYKNSKYKQAVKVALAIGDDANIDVLRKFTDGENNETKAVITTYTPESLKKWIKKISLVASRSASETDVTSNKTKQQVMEDTLQEIAQTDPDLSTISTDGNDW